MPLRETDIFELPLVFICLERVTGMLWTRDLRRGTNCSFQCQRQSHRVGDSETAKLTSNRDHVMTESREMNMASVRC